MLAAHRVPPQMMGIIPNNTGGFGDVEKASRVFVRNELMPLQKRFEELNAWPGEEVIRFTPYTLDLADNSHPTWRHITFINQLNEGVDGGVINFEGKELIIK